MILLSAHYDKVKPESELKFEGGTHIGLLDNIIGVIATYLAIYNNKSILIIQAFQFSFVVDFEESDFSR